MYESAEELVQLQQLLDRSASTAGEQMRSIFKPEHRLSARQVSSYFQGVKQVAAATVNSRGEPSVAPIDAVLYHGRFYLSTDGKKSLRARHLLKNPALGLTYFEGADPVIIARGRAELIGLDQPEFTPLDREWVRAYGKSILELSDSVVFIRLQSTSLFAFSFHPERFKDA